MKAVDAKVELEYWLQIVYDSEQALSNLGNINKQLECMIDPTTNLVKYWGHDPNLMINTEKIMDAILEIQDSLELAIARNRLTGQLIDGRLQMLRNELGLDNGT